MTNQECDCIFCNSKCPECGAEDIEVTYSPVFNYHNNSEDFIFISLMDDKIELMCSSCGAWIHHDEFSSEPNKLEGLTGALRKGLGISGNKYFKYDEHGEYKEGKIVSVSKKTDKSKGGD